MQQNDIAALVDTYGNMILRLAYTYLKNKADAEDIVQDVFMQVIEKNPVWNNKAHQKAWLLRTTVNLCKNKLNVFWNRNKCSIDDAAEVGDCDDYHTDTDVLQAVMKLGRDYRLVVHMYYYEGYSTPEIAKILGKNEATVRSLLHRARKTLKKELKEAYDFE